MTHAIDSHDIVKSDGRRERGRQRQRAQIEAARDLFIAHGYRGTTLEAIIARAGGSRETIYRIFGGKRGLFAAIIAQTGEKLAEAVDEPVALALSPRDALINLGLQLADVWRSDEGKAINRVVLSEGLEAPDLVDAWFGAGPALSIAALSHYLQVQVDRRRLKPHDCVLVARQFVMLLMGELAFPLISGRSDPESTSARVARCADLIVAAYQP